MPTKTIKAEHDAESGIVVASNVVRMNGNKDNYVMADEKGITINGPMSFVSGSGQMRFSGLWVMQNEMMLSLPSTLATPTPVMTINPPIGQMASLVKDAVIMMGLLGMIGGLS
jgi:hypothetical protein